MSKSSTSRAVFSVSSVGDVQFNFFTECTMLREGDRIQISYQEKLSFLETTIAVSFNKSGIFMERKLHNPIELFADGEDIVSTEYLSADDEKFDTVALEIGPVKLLIFNKDLQITFLPDGLEGTATALTPKDNRIRLTFRVREISN